MQITENIIKETIANTKILSWYNLLDLY